MKYQDSHTVVMATTKRELFPNFAFVFDRTHLTQSKTSRRPRLGKPNMGIESLAVFGLFEPSWIALSVNGNLRSSVKNNRKQHCRSMADVEEETEAVLTGYHEFHDS